MPAESNRGWVVGLVGTILLWACGDDGPYRLGLVAPAIPPAPMTVEGLAELLSWSLSNRQTAGYRRLLHPDFTYQESADDQTHRFDFERELAALDSLSYQFRGATAVVEIEPAGSGQWRIFLDLALLESEDRSLQLTHSGLLTLEEYGADAHLSIRQWVGEENGVGGMCTWGQLKDLALAGDSSACFRSGPVDEPIEASRKP